ncbi:VCBS repeat-containing protein, partial [Argonema galeatum A003/A1]|nr:VCBS repeat-containing protein [Argonema galeatum A003/A1]
MTAGTAPSESGPTNGIFNISLNAASPTPITVSFDTTGSTATSATDYSFDLATSTGITAITASSFTIAAGVTSATLVAKPVDDAVIEAGGETVKVNLLSGTGYTLDTATATTTFAAATNFAVGTNPYSVTVGDFNGDGKTDIAAANRTSNNVSVLLGTGTGSFGAATNFAVGNSPLSVTVGDFNGDGKTDIAAANFNSNNVSVLLGTGTGSFGAATN